MRYIFAIAVVFAALGVLPESRSFLKDLPGESMESLRDIAFTKDISVSGAHFVTEDEVRGSLPLDRSVFWWLVNPDDVVADIKAHRYVESAKVTSCSDLIFDAWGCFKVNVHEHQPRFIVQQSDSAWLASSEGVFLKPISEALTAENRELLENEYGELTLVSGLSTSGASPDLISVRFDYLRTTVGIIEQELNRSISEAIFNPNGELTVSLKDSGLRARFAYAEDNWGTLKDSSTRLRTLLEELRGRESSVELIDLSYQKLAVVKKYPIPESAK